MKPKPTNTVVLVHPQDILHRHLREAAKPFAADLRQAAAIDRELAKELDATHPDTAKREAEQLLERAANGDSKAEGILRSAGGTESYIKDKCAMFDLARAKHEGAAKATVPLWERVAVAVVAAINAANSEIQEQWKRTCEHLGEPCDLSSWDAYCRNLKNGISKAAWNAEQLKTGAAWQIEQLGLSEVIA